MPRFHPHRIRSEVLFRAATGEDRGRYRSIPIAKRLHVVQPCRKNLQRKMRRLVQVRLLCGTRPTLHSRVAAR